MILSLKHLFSKCASKNKDRCYKHISLSLRKDTIYIFDEAAYVLNDSGSFNAETGFPAVKNNR